MSLVTCNTYLYTANAVNQSTNYWSHLTLVYPAVFREALPTAMNSLIWIPWKYMLEKLCPKHSWSNLIKRTR